MDCFLKDIQNFRISLLRNCNGKNVNILLLHSLCFSLSSPSKCTISHKLAHRGLALISSFPCVLTSFNKSLYEKSILLSKQVYLFFTALNKYASIAILIVTRNLIVQLHARTMINASVIINLHFASCSK